MINTNKTVHFLAGLPRTGSTLLGSIMSQHPDVHVTSTSPLYSFLVNANEHFNYLNLQYTFDHQEISNKIYKSIVAAFCDNLPKPIVFDKFRGWPKHVPAIAKFINPNPKIVCTVRPIVEVISSYLVLAEKDKDNFIDEHLKREGQPLSNESRANLLWTKYLNIPYECLMVGICNYRDNLLLVEYDDLITKPAKTLNRINQFCEIKPFNYKFSGIKNLCAEAKDEAWGLKGLHDIRPQLSRRSVSPLDLLPASAVSYFSQFDVRV